MNRIKNLQIIFVILMLFLLLSEGFAAWYRSLVGTAPNVINQLCIGNGRNDGIQRVYAVCEDGHVYEWTYTVSGWSRVDMGEAGGTGWCLGIVLGDGRNEGLNRIYMTRINGQVYEYFYSGGSWVITDLLNPNSSLYGVTIGKGRNDGINRVYACGDGVPTVEYTWIGSIWDKDTVQANQRQWLPEIGNGRNDGLNRLYFPNGLGSIRTVAEYTWSGSSYTRADLPSCTGNPLSVAIGPGRNDGVNRIYSSTRTRAYEFTYQTGSWQMADILPSFGDESRYDIFLGRTKSDGKLHVYITCSGTQLLETTWSGSTWVDSVVDAVSSATCGVFVGRGRNDDTTRVYGCNRNGEVYEFTHSSPYVGLEEQFVPNQSILILEQNYPNPFNTNTQIEYTLPEENRVSIVIYNIIGEKVRVLVNQKQKSGHYIVTWDGCNEVGKKMTAGIYFYRLQVGTPFEVKKLLILR